VRVEVRLFAVARQRVGLPAVALEVPEPATVAALKRALAEAYPALAPLVPNLLIAVNSEYAAADAAIPPGAEVAAFPPVSGGGACR
jgi:molybdopterin converting factor subunit 1